jgi:hypothetical protein
MLLSAKRERLIVLKCDFSHFSVNQDSNLMELCVKKLFLIQLFFA